MAPRLPKRQLQPEDLKDTQRVLEALNPLLESHSLALAGGISVDNLRHVTLDVKLTPPDEWTPLELLNGATPYANAGFGAPAVRWNAGVTEYRGLLNRPAAGASFVPFARIPATVETLRPNITTPLPCLTSPYAAGAVEITTGGDISLPAPTTFPAAGWIALTGLSHASTHNPPLWAKPVDATLKGEGGADYGVPLLVLCLGATRVDRVTCQPDLTPVWEAPLMGQGKSMERKLRIHRLGGLDAGIEHVVTFLCIFQ